MGTSTDAVASARSKETKTTAPCTSTRARSPGQKDLLIDRGGNLAQVHHRHLHCSASAPPRQSCSHSRRRRRCRPAAEMKPRHQRDSGRDKLKKGLSCEIPTRHTSLAAVIFVAPQLDGVVGRVSLALLFWSSSHSNSLSIQYLVVSTRSPFRWTCDRAWDKGNTTPQRVACLDSCHNARLGRAAPQNDRIDSPSVVRRAARRLSPGLL